ncbi:hypothetical protein TCSYLVIO_010073 [Trypanosoma cruzi]|nr:hypothetical protein TCSYLVIO_010073 [Trypanosoma cruzi]
MGGCSLFEKHRMCREQPIDKRHASHFAQFICALLRQEALLLLHAPPLHRRELLLHQPHKIRAKVVVWKCPRGAEHLRAQTCHGVLGSGRHINTLRTFRLLQFLTLVHCYPSVRAHKEHPNQQRTKQNKNKRERDGKSQTNKIYFLINSRKQQPHTHTHKQMEGEALHSSNKNVSVKFYQITSHRKDSSHCRLPTLYPSTINKKKSKAITAQVTRGQVTVSHSQAHPYTFRFLLS